jgi:hypothetical protein
VFGLSVVKDLHALHGLVHMGAGDVPTAENKIVQVNHGEDVTYRDMGPLPAGGVGAHLDSRGAEWNRCSWAAGGLL